jgi:Fe-S-cluster containining protein
LKQLPWWQDGLRFSCARCGACCGREPGTVSFTQNELAAMSSSLNISEDEFKLLYTWRKYGGLSLREETNYDCVFLLKNDPYPGCRVYPSRPAQCSSFPFWPEILKSSNSWDEYARSCPGMNNGEFHRGDEIFKIVLEYASNVVPKFL